MNVVDELSFISLNFHLFSIPFAVMLRVFLLFSFNNSSATLKVGNDVGTVLGVCDSSEGHGVAWGESGWLFQPLVEVTVGPFDGSF